MKVTEMSHPSSLSRAWHKGMPSYLAGEGRYRDAIVTMGGTRIPKMPGMKSDVQAVPTRNDRCHITPHMLFGNNQRQRLMYKVYKRLLKIFRNADYMTMNYELQK